MTTREGRSPAAAEVVELLDGRLDAPRALELRRQIRRDEAARALYDRLAEAEGALDPASLQRRMEARLFADLAARGVLPVPERGREERRPAAVLRRLARRSRASAGFFAAAGLAALALFAPVELAVSPEHYEARSGGGERLDADHVLQVLRARLDPGGALHVEPARRVGPGDHLRFAVFHRRSGARLSLLALHEGERRVLLDGVPLDHAGRTERLDFALRVAPQWRGVVRVVALFDYGAPPQPWHGELGSPRRAAALGARGDPVRRREHPMTFWPLLFGLAGVPTASYDSPAVFAVIVANNDPGPLGRDLTSLRYADDDGARYLELFGMVAQQAILHSVLDTDSQALFPEAAASSRPPTRTALLRSLEAVFGAIERARAEGRRTELYFVFVGHGSVSSGGEGVMHLLDGGFSRSDLFQQVVDPSPADLNHVIVDACNAFLFVGGRGEDSRRERIDAAVDQYLARERMARHPNTGFVLSTSAAAEVHEWSGFEAGVFSHEVRSALLGGGDVDGDGAVTYEELKAFLQAANGMVENPKAKLQPWVAPPPMLERAPLFARAWLREGAASVHIGAQLAGRWSLEDDRGVRVADVHLAEDGPVTLLLPGRRTHRLHRGQRQVLIDPGAAVQDVIDASELEASATDLLTRSIEPESFRQHLFAIPFGQAFLTGYRSASTPARVIEVDAPPPDRTARHWMAATLLVLGTSSLVAGVVAGQLATRSADRYRAAIDRPYEVRAMRGEVRDRETAANLLLGGGITLLLGGGVVLTW